MQEVPKQLERLVREWAVTAQDCDLRKSIQEFSDNFAGLIPILAGSDHVLHPSRLDEQPGR
jgi:hypothetical protein